MIDLTVKDALNAEGPLENVRIRGWVRTRRDSKGFSFLEINDGSCLKNLQAILDADAPGYASIEDANTGAAVAVIGDLVESPGKGQAWELKGRELSIVGTAPEDYPLQKKRHSDEYLRTIAHLRPRTNKYSAMARIRSEAAFAVHRFFHNRGFHYVHTPIITGSDCEGAGEMFRVTTLPPGYTADKDSDYHTEDFFGRAANLTVSGQLEAEPYALALSKVYTFGPTFRAENSNTPRHAAEFWMIEPEMAFYDLSMNMDLAEEFTKDLLTSVLDASADDIELFARFVDKELMSTLENIVSQPFERVPYREAVEILKQSKQTFDYPVEFGTDLQTEHERYLTETHFRRPVIVHDYPRSIKPFYMRVNDDAGDPETVAAMDLLVPRIGELIGGSQREERLDVLEARMDECSLDKAPYWWYLELRKFGSAPHAGFGLGFERLLMLVTGITNIRDVIAFPRTPRHLDF
ncbi:asparagine--tRNA ligase [Oceanidesulfovibrio indonesiensis]|uniref:Asparagine--tRNA ligase n=1 Tax=Oceanidesulfovibrio indonesiensis TaxID=54767 RepID=A0A7M3MA90_9BACT|nr:asparagine--tRNA ligase [Oceanidesulfovibrio indonesiensis]TVM14532.1 asparagine--tRNA ligase [Oceanidesulfovibrio indonesiensis]